MSKFKVGDYVTPITNDFTDLTIGKIYKVAVCLGDIIMLEEDDAEPMARWLCATFKLAETQQPKKKTKSDRIAELEARVAELERGNKPYDSVARRNRATSGGSI